MITIQDVARRSGVSATTVSHVINKTRYVRPELADRVMHAVGELGYTPLRVSHRQKLCGMRVAGIFLSSIRGSYASDLADCLAAELLDDWMHRAAYCKIAKVVAVEKKVRRRRDDIIAAVELGISNGRVEAINNKIKVAVRMGYGFRNTDNLVALLMLRCGDCQPQLPGRPVKARKKGVKGAKSVAA